MTREEIAKERAEHPANFEKIETISSECFEVLEDLQTEVQGLNGTWGMFMTSKDVARAENVLLALRELFDKIENGLI